MTSRDRVIAMEAVELMPESVVLDHSFVFAALESEARHHAAAADFLERLTRGGTRLLFTDLLELQLHDRAFATAIRAQSASQRRSGRTPSAGADELARAFIGRWRNVLLESDAVHVEVSDLMDDLMYYSERFRLSSISAVHAALVMAADADGLATVDPTFGAVDASLLPLFLPRDVVRFARRGRELPA
ncbi:hypothetical protein NS184_10640 [Curtobacterium luteum]|uniref:PIN domain-containing protein n=2 Tax=Curtobacterium luteum TaxID=33881 RepID=A0A175RNA7_9MICO|nr:hypothetical protein NS184_10640 [Curtobacterium luteum]